VLRALRAAALLALALCLDGRAADAACAGCARAGAARVALTIPDGTPLAGYGDLWRRALVPDILGRHPHAFWFRPSEGSRDPLAARALVVEGGGRRLTWLAVDLVAVDRAFTARVARALEAAGLSPGTLIVSASHTHSGPGAFMESGVMGFVAADRQDGRVRDALVSSLVEATRRADAALVPARFGSASVPGPNIQRGRLGRPVDREIVVLRIAAESGAPIATLWNYAIHGTTLPAVNLRFSGDVMGRASEELERLTGAPALFVNGAVADVSPSRHGQVESDAAGRELAAAARKAWDAAGPAGPVTLAMASTRVVLPPPFLSVRNCTASWMPRWLTAPLGAVLPAETELIAGRLGDVAWVTMPGELQSSLGQAVKRAAGSAFSRVLIAGLSNEYLGYFLTPADYTRVTYVSCATLYGPDAGDLLARAAERLLRDLPPNGARQ
jgi:hypothetical protein